MLFVYFKVLISEFSHNNIIMIGLHNSKRLKAGGPRNEIAQEANNRYNYRPGVFGTLGKN